MPGSEPYRGAMKWAEGLLADLESAAGYSVLRDRIVSHALDVLEAVARIPADESGAAQQPLRLDLDLMPLRTLLLLARQLGVLDEKAFRRAAMGLDRILRPK